MTNRARMRSKRRRKKSANHAGIVIESELSPPEVQRAIQRKFREARERNDQEKGCRRTFFPVELQGVIYDPFIQRTAPLSFQAGAYRMGVDFAAEGGDKSFRAIAEWRTDDSGNKYLHIEEI